MMVMMMIIINVSLCKYVSTLAQNFNTTDKILI